MVGFCLSQSKHGLHSKRFRAIFILRLLQFGKLYQTHSISGEFSTKTQRENAADFYYPKIFSRMLFHRFVKHKFFARAYTKKRSHNFAYMKDRGTETYTATKNSYVFSNRQHSRDWKLCAVQLMSRMPLLAYFTVLRSLCEQNEAKPKRLKQTKRSINTKRALRHRNVGLSVWCAALSIRNQASISFYFCKLVFRKSLHQAYLISFKSKTRWNRNMCTRTLAVNGKQLFGIFPRCSVSALTVNCCQSLLLLLLSVSCFFLSPFHVPRFAFLFDLYGHKFA